MSQLPWGNWVNSTKARKPQYAYKSVPKLCSYLLRHDTSISHGSDGGDAMSVILNEIRIGAEGDSGRRHVRDGFRLIDM